MAKKGKKKKKLSAEERLLRQKQRRFRNQIAFIFRAAGFDSIITRNNHFEFKGLRSEFDNIFLLNNLVVVAEETLLNNSDQIRNHLLKKDVVYRAIKANQQEFIEFLMEKFPAFKTAVKKKEYHPSDMNVVIIYCTKNRMEDEQKKPFAGLIFMEDRHIQYFCSLGKTLGKSARFEMFKFFSLKTDDLQITIGETDVTYNGFILPESPSGFPNGYKVVTFYIDPNSLLLLSYVLRKDGWGDSENLYQRMISYNKIKSMRRFLGQENRVFINNVIVSLPSTTKVLDINNKQIDITQVARTTAVRIQIPKQFNSIGIIDGQHRVFAYHEGYDEFEPQIAKKREKQQLLVTGVVYPREEREDTQHEFEAKLFLEINDKQTKTKADLRQAIESIVNPFSVVAISRSIINKLAANGPLCGFLEEHQFDRGKLKSSSIVSYGLRHIVKNDGGDTLFKIWKHPQKEALAVAIKAASLGNKRFSKPSKNVLEDYVQFCAKEINYVLAGYKSVIPKEIWTIDRKKSRAITTTAINGVIYCLRNLLENNKIKTIEEYLKVFPKLTVKFTPDKFKYKSSHWKSLGDKIFQDCF